MARAFRFLATALVAGLAAGCAPAAPPRPNVVLLIADTLRADVLGAYGGRLGASPELDALAAAGVLCERVVAPCPWTRPSMGALLTGQYPRTLGLYEEGNEVLKDSFRTLAERLRDLGYATYGATANPMINAAFGFAQGFDVYLDSLAPEVRAAVSARGTRCAAARDLFAAALVRLRQEPRRPVFLQLAVMEMHEYWRGPRSLTRPEFGGLFERAESAAYYRALRQLSFDAGVFLQDLAALPGFEDTLFVLTSDHGEGLHSHYPVPYTQFHGAILYESNTLVPLILHRTGGALAPRRVRRPVRLIDVMPTLLELAGGAADAGIAGVSLAPLLRGEGAPAGLPEQLVAETTFRYYEKQAVYCGAWNYYEHQDGHQGMDAREVQAAGAAELGRLSNKLAEQPEVAARAAAALRAFEAAYPRAAVERRHDKLPADLAEELRGLGYLGGASASRRSGGERR